MLKSNQEGDGRLRKTYAFFAIFLAIVACAILFYVNFLISFEIALILPLCAFVIFLVFGSRKPREFNGNFDGKVSIVIAARNEEAVIEKTIRNLEENEYRNFEILVINDGSTDSTSEILKRLERTFSNLHVIDIPIEEQHGKVKALNMASKMINGDLMMILDADAWVEKDYISRAVKPFANPSIGFSQTGRRIFNYNFDHLLVPMIYDGDFALTNIMMEYFISPRSFGSGFTLRTDHVKDVFPLRNSISDDQQMSNLLSKRKIKGVLNPTVIFYESAPLNFKTLLRQRKRWFLGSFIEMLHNNVSGFFLNTFFIFFADIALISIFVGRFSILAFIVVLLMLFALIMLLIHRKSFRIQNTFLNWIGAMLSYFLDVLICNLSIFLSVVKFGKDLEWFKTPREGIQI